MNITELKYFAYIGRMTRSIRSRRRMMKYKSGVILRLKNSFGQFGYGEASPLEGFSRESISDVLNGLEKLNEGINDNRDIEDIISGEEYNEIPSLMFGLEQALYGMKLAEGISSPLAEKAIPVNYLIGSSELDETIEAASMAHAMGWKAIKLKLAVKPFDAELETIRNIQSLLPDFKLRFDMNGAWSLSEAVRCINLLSEFNVEYIEQPVEGLKPLLELAGKVDVPVAPDESIISVDDAMAAIEHPSINYIVIKPMKFGFNNTCEVIKAANSSGKKVIISTLFESTIGLKGLLYLASLTDHQSAHGIYNYLVVDELKQIEPLNIQDGSINFDNDSMRFDEIESLFG